MDVLDDIGADQIPVDTAEFDNNLSVADDTVQKALETLDEMAGGGEANTASNVGTGQGDIFKQKTVADLELKTIKAGANITIVNNESDITIIAAAGVAGATVLLETLGFEGVNWNVAVISLQNLSEFASGIMI